MAATVFGELWRLEPLAPQKKAMWRREMEWLLCVSDSIVELVPSIQQFPGGGTYEVMATRPRSDLYINLPALKKLDALLITMLDGFRETEFWYVDRSKVFVQMDKPDVSQEVTSFLFFDFSECILSFKAKHLINGYLFLPSLMIMQLYLSIRLSKSYFSCLM